MAKIALAEVEFAREEVLTTKEGERIIKRIVTRQDGLSLLVDEETGVLFIGPRHMSIHSPKILSWTPIGALGVAAKEKKRE